LKNILSIIRKKIISKSDKELEAIIASEKGFKSGIISEKSRYFSEKIFGFKNILYLCSPFYVMNLVLK